MIRGLAAMGLLDGVECYYAEHTPEQLAQFLGLCRELGLVPTGGSDFHGPRVRAATLGQPAVPWDAWEALRRRAGRGGGEPRPPRATAVAGGLYYFERFRWLRENF